MHNYNYAIDFKMDQAKVEVAMAQAASRKATSLAVYQQETGCLWHVPFTHVPTAGGRAYSSIERQVPTICVLVRHLALNSLRARVDGFSKILNETGEIRAIAS